MSSSSAAPIRAASNTRAVARQQFRTFEPRLAITYLTGLPTQELEAAARDRCRNIPSSTTSSSTGTALARTFNPFEYLDALGSVANAPIYCWVDSDDRPRHRRRQPQEPDSPRCDAVARLGGPRAARGAADGIPMSTADLNVTQVDWRAAATLGHQRGARAAGHAGRCSASPRSGIATDSTSSGPLALVLAQTVLIAGLLVQRTRRRQAEAQVSGSQEELRTSYDRIRDLGGRLLSAQETERARIARELHDDISQQVALLSIDLELLEERPGRSGQQLAGDALSRAQQVAKSVHDLSHRLHPARLRLIGLVPALNGLQQELSQSGIPITFTHDDVPSDAPAGRHAVCVPHRAGGAAERSQAQPRARNIGRPDGPSTDALVLTVADDGVGFDVNAAWGRGLGLISMSERLEAIDGTFDDSLDARRRHPPRGRRAAGRVRSDAFGAGLRDADSA